MGGKEGTHRRRQRSLRDRGGRPVGSLPQPDHHHSYQPSTQSPLVCAKTTSASDSGSRAPRSMRRRNAPEELFKVAATRVRSVLARSTTLFDPLRPQAIVLSPPIRVRQDIVRVGDLWTSGPGRSATLSPKSALLMIIQGLRPTFWKFSVAFLRSGSDRCGFRSGWVLSDSFLYAVRTSSAVGAGMAVRPRMA